MHPWQEYVAEALDWSVISFRDNQPVIDLIAKKPQGLLIMLEEQVRPCVSCISFLFCFIESRPPFFIYTSMCPHNHHDPPTTSNHHRACWGARPTTSRY